MVEVDVYLLYKTPKINKQTCLSAHKHGANRPFSIYKNSNMSPRLRGIKQNILIFYSSTSASFLLLYSPRPRSHVGILIYRKWSICFLLFSTPVPSVFVPLDQRSIRQACMRSKERRPRHEVGYSVNKSNNVASTFKSFCSTLPGWMLAHCSSHYFGLFTEAFDENEL